MSVRPSAAGTCPWSGRIRSDSDSRTRAFTCWRTESPPLVWRPGRIRRLGRSSKAHRLAACRSHCWLMPVNDTVPQWPKIARSHWSPSASLAGVASARRACRTSAFTSPAKAKDRVAASW